MNTILITGASTGIGRAAANYFAGRGWNVVATMRSPERGTEWSACDNVLVLKLDVEKEDTIQAALAEAIGHFGKIDVLLNNAGYGTMGLIEAANEEQIRRQFEVNVFGLIRTTKAILPHFRSNQAGMLINISSMGGRVTFPTMSLYHSSKFAVEGFSESVYYELASQNIQVKLIEPGAIQTDFGGRSMAFYFDDTLTDYEAFTTAFRSKLSDMEKQPSYASPPEIVAETIYQAATDGSRQFRYVVGEDAKMLIHMKENTDEVEYLMNIAQHFA